MTRETLFKDMTIGEFLEVLSRDVPTLPGGGCAAALTGSIAASLGLFVARLSARYLTDPDIRNEFSEIAEQFESLKEKCLEMMETDVREYEGILRAIQMPKSAEEERSRRNAALEQAHIAALSPPITVAECGSEMLRLSQKLIEKGYGPALPDAEVVKETARACLHSSLQIARANFSGISDRSLVEHYQKLLDRLESEG